jgi:pimeloyl-ACP methyl ester carboxylesterase
MATLRGFIDGNVGLFVSLLIANVLAAALNGCAHLRSDSARATAARIAESAQLSAVHLETRRFTLAAYQRIEVGPDDTLVVYIEGDGLAWITRGQLSENPTPPDPIGLRLAARDDAPTVLYLARPCQFVTGRAARNCESKYWSTARFAIEVVEAVDEAVNIVKRVTGKPKVELIGYSGGGTLATLLAAHRQDVSRVITIAANLDPSFWAVHHGVTPLHESLNPINFATRLGRIPQVIFVGGRDRIVPASVSAHYRQALPRDTPVTIITIASFTHTCCWADRWPELLRQARTAPSLWR